MHVVCTRIGAVVLALVSGIGTASAAATRIDPVHDLVIVMTRNRAGRNFHKYHQKFIDAVVAGLAD